MTIKGNADRYGTLAATLHWVSAAAILALLAIGFVAANTVDAALAAALLRVHVPLGMLVLALTLTRLAWALFDRRPGAPAGQPRWQLVSARLNHMLLYGVLILMGASGIGVMILSGAAATLFLGAPGPLPRFDTLPPMAVHAVGAFALIGLAGIHVGAALHHQFLRRDRLLARMGIGQAGTAAARRRTPGRSGTSRHGRSS